MAVPKIELLVEIDVESTVGDDTGPIHIDSITAAYDVTGTIIDPNSKAIEIFRIGEDVPIATIVSGSFIDLSIRLPEFRSYRANYVGSTESTTFSVNQDDFSGVIDSILLEGSYQEGTISPSVPTEFGIPVSIIQYDGPSLTTYSQDRFSSELNIVPFFIAATEEPWDVISFSDYIQQDNQSFLVSYDENIELNNNGLSFPVNSGYTYMSFMNTPGVVKFESLRILMKKIGLLGSGVVVNIYTDSAGSPVYPAVSSSFVAHVNIPDEMGIVEFPLPAELSLDNFWIEIVSLNIESFYEIGLSDLSFNTSLYASRYTRLFDAGAIQGDLYTDALIALLDSLYGPGTYPVLVTGSDESVQLNELYVNAFGFDNGFDGPCIVSYPEISVLQIGGDEILFGPDGLSNAGEFVSRINLIKNYTASIGSNISIEENSLYTEFRSPSVTNPTTPISSKLLFSAFQSPDGNNRRVVIRSSSVYSKYNSRSTINLRTPIIGPSDEWFPSISAGFIKAIKYEIGDSIFVEGFGLDTVVAISESQITLDNNGAIANPLLFSVSPPLEYPLVEFGESPVQISESTFKLSKGPLYTDGLGDIFITLVTGDRYESDITNRIIDWDPDNSIIVLDTRIKFKESVFAKYKYVEKGVILPIDIKPLLDSSVEIFLGSDGSLVYKDLPDESYVEAGILFMHIGSYLLSTLTASDDIEIKDLRIRGGGLASEISFEEAFIKNVGVVGYYDIGFNDGRNIPQMVLSAKIPKVVLDIMEDHEIESEIHKHADIGTKIYKDYTDEYIEFIPPSGPILDEGGTPLDDEGGTPLELEG